MARDAVARETPATRATSSSVGEVDVGVPGRVILVTVSTQPSVAGRRPVAHTSAYQRALALGVLVWVA